MDAKKCDLCGGYYDEPEKDPKYILARRMFGKRLDDEFDLCPNCQKLLNAWVDGDAVISMISKPEDEENYVYEFRDDGIVVKKEGDTK